MRGRIDSRSVNAEKVVKGNERKARFRENEQQALAGGVVEEMGS
jgi:hypothetical protein